MNKTESKKPDNRRELMIKNTMVAGAFIWASTVFLRDTNIMENRMIRFWLGVAPNFGAVWMTFGLTYTILIPLKQKSNFKYSIPLILIILALLLVSEVMHDLLLNAPFDVWDMAASVVAAVILWLLIVIAPCIH